MSFAEEGQGYLRRDLYVVFNLHHDLLPLSIAIDQQSNSILFVLILFGIFFQHNRVKKGIDTLKLWQICEKLLFGLFVYIKPFVDILNSFLKVSCLCHILKDVYQYKSGGNHKFGWKGNHIMNSWIPTSLQLLRLRTHLPVLIDYSRIDYILIYLYKHSVIIRTQPLEVSLKKR